MKKLSSGLAGLGFDSKSWTGYEAWLRVKPLNSQVSVSLSMRWERCEGTGVRFGFPLFHAPHPIMTQSWQFCIRRKSSLPQDPFLLKLSVIYLVLAKIFTSAPSSCNYSLGTLPPLPDLFCQFHSLAQKVSNPPLPHNTMPACTYIHTHMHMHIHTYVHTNDLGLAFPGSRAKDSSGSASLGMCPRKHQWGVKK